MSLFKETMCQGCWHLTTACLLLKSQCLLSHFCCTNIRHCCWARYQAGMASLRRSYIACAHSALNQNQECDPDATVVSHHAACVWGLFACIYSSCQCAARLELCVQLRCCSYSAQTLVTDVIIQSINHGTQATIYFCRLL